MDTLITAITFTFPHEAHFAKAKLESEGVEVFIKDEMTVQVHNFYSNAIGGVKLQVRSAEFDTAHRILVESGYIEEHESKQNKFLSKLDKWTSQLPLMGSLRVELKLLISVFIILTVVVVSIVLLALP